MYVYFILVYWYIYFIKVSKNFHIITKIIGLKMKNLELKWRLKESVRENVYSNSYIVTKLFMENLNT